MATTDHAPDPDDGRAPAPTPSQTIGPFLHIGLPWEQGPDVVPADTPHRCTVSGRIFDGAGAPVSDALVETWQCDPHGRFPHPAAPAGTRPSPDGFRGFGRCPTDREGCFAVHTRKPGALPADTGALQAPHIDVLLFARGLLDRLVTRIYFPDEEAANGADPVLASLPPERARTLVATAAPGGYHLDIHLQGPKETVFFDV